MKELKHHDGKSSATPPTSAAENKPRYEPPLVMSLGEFARGWGHGHGQCPGGPDASGQCGGGGTANGGCGGGHTAIGMMGS
jgi:hypothetical protein